MLDVEDIFAELHAVACERLGEEFFVDLGIGDPEEFPEARNMAYTAACRACSGTSLGMRRSGTWSA